MPFQTPDEFYYQHATTTVSYSHQPQNKLNIQRLLNQEPCWESKKHCYTLKPKSLILADWSLNYRNIVHFVHIRNYVKHLIENGFEIYVWIDRNFVKLNHYSFLHNPYEQEDCTSIPLNRIEPETSEKIIEKAVKDLGIPKDQLFVLQSNHIDQYTGMLEGDERNWNKYIINLNCLNEYLDESNVLSMCSFLMSELPKIDGWCGDDENCPFAVDFLLILPKFYEFFDDEEDDDDQVIYENYCSASMIGSRLKCDQSNEMESIKRLNLHVTFNNETIDHQELSKLKVLKDLRSINFDCIGKSQSSYDTQEFFKLAHHHRHSLKSLSLKSVFIHHLTPTEKTEPFEVLNQLYFCNMFESVTQDKLNYLLSLMPELIYFELSMMSSESFDIELGQIKELNLFWVNPDTYKNFMNPSLIRSLNRALCLENLEMTFQSVAGVDASDSILEVEPCLSQLRRLKLMNNQNSIIFSDTVTPLIKNSPHLESLVLQNFEFYDLSEEDEKSLVSLTKIELNACRLSTTFCHQTFTNLRQLILKNVTTEDCFENSQFPMLTDLSIESSNMSHEELKQLLQAAPALQCIVIQYSNFEDFDEELEALFQNIPHRVLVEPDEDQRIEFMMDSGNFKPNSKNHEDSLNFALDSNTEDIEETTHHINLIFTSESGLPDPDHSFYRLESFDELNLSDFTKLMSRAEGQEIFSNHVYPGACFVKERNYEFYKGEYKVFLSQHWMALPSLSILDKLIGLKTLPEIKNIQVCYSKRYHQYFISAPDLITPKEVRVTFRIHTCLTQANILNNLPQEIITKFNELSTFESGQLEGDQSTPINLLNTLERERKGACRHRAILFKRFAQQFNIPCRVQTNDTHAFVEFFYQNYWYVFDLGGYPTNVNIYELEKTNKEIVLEKKYEFKKELEQRIEKLKAEHEIELASCIDLLTEQLLIDEFNQNVERLIAEETKNFERTNSIKYLENDDESGENSIIEKEIIDFFLMPSQNSFDHQEDLLAYLSSCDAGSRILVNINREESLKCSLMLEQALQSLDFHVFVAHSSEDLICSNYLAKQVDGYGVKQSPGGPLYQFLNEQESRLVLIIDYTHFKPEEIVRFSHSLFDITPKADGVSVPKHLQIIGIYDLKNPNSYVGDDFIGRFHEQVLADFKPSLPNAFEAPDEILEDYVIELSQSSQWQEQTIGQWGIRDGRPYFVEPTQQQIPANARLVYNHPPTDDHSFNVFYAKAQMQGTYELAQTNVLNWQGVHISPLLSFSPRTLVLNMQTASEFHKKFDLNPQGFNLIPGYIEQHQGTVIEIFVNDLIDEMTFDAIFQWAKKYQCMLQIAFSTTVYDQLMSEFFIDRVGRLEYEDLQDNIICTPDPDLYLAILAQEQSSCAASNEMLVIHVDDLNIEDLFYQYELETCHDVSILHKKEQDLYRLLQEGQRVILTGQFSKRLSLELSALLIQEQDSEIFRRLIIINQEGIPGILGQTIEISQEQKLGLLMSRFAPELIDGEDIHKGFVELCARLEFRSRFPDACSDELYAGLHEIKKFRWNQAFCFETAEAECEAFIRDRKVQVYKTLEGSPYVYLSGLTGVGKSQFVEKECYEHQVFKEKNSLVEWAQARPVENEFLILFFDEANLCHSQWMAFEGMFAANPYVYIEGKLLELTRNHKVIFAGNPTQYGDDRKIPQLIKRHGLSVVFEPLSPAFIFHKIIYPLMTNPAITGFSPLLGEEYAFRVAPIILEMYQFLLECSKQTIIVTPRQIETICLMLATYDAQEMENLDVVRFYCHEVFESCLSANHYQMFARQFPKPPRPYSNYQRIQESMEDGSLYITESRREVLEKIMDFLNIQGGINRLVIEGEPGIGKSALTLKLLNTLYTENQEFVYMPASLSLNEKKELMLQAFDRGQIVFTDEINSSVFFEQILNSLLDNKHPDENGRPANQPGFKLIGTQNSINLSGRNVESPALKSRSMHVCLPSYQPDEVYSIAISLGVDAFYSASLEQAYAKTKPSFRKVLNWISKGYTPREINQSCSFFCGMIDTANLIECQDDMDSSCHRSV